MIVKKSTMDLIGRIIVYALLIVVSVLFLLPFLWMVSTALKPIDKIFTIPPQFIPQTFMWQNFTDAINAIPFWTYLSNTLIYAVFSMLGTVLSSTVIAYGFSRLRWKGRDTVFFIVLMTMMLPYQVTMIPLFIIFKNLGFVNTLLPLIVPSFFGVPFYIFLIRQFMMSIPKEMSEAARIDGASEWGILWRIIVPITKPALWTVAIFQMIAAWQDFLGPLIYLSDESKYTMSLGLQQFQTAHGAIWNQLMAVSLIMTIPMIVLFFITQKALLEGLTLTGSIKA